MTDQSLLTSPNLERPRRLHHDAYTVAIICPMGDELSPVFALLDETHENLSTSRDQNAYKLGTMGQHNVVVAGMPMIGNNAASMVVTQLLNDFGRIRFGLLVGVGGGIPDEDYEDDNLNDIRLGDVVVSESQGLFGAVVQFDRGKSITEGFIKTGHQNKPPHVLAANVETLKALHNLHGNDISRYFGEMLRKYPGMEEKYSHPGSESDRLYKASYTHQSGKTCKKCDITQTVQRSQRKSSGPRIHYGTIGSSNMVIEDTQKRDELRNMEILCVEMEAAGLMEAFPCLVIRGISDYVDSHKNKRWQPYAAAMAAAYMKELLSQIPTDAVQRVQSITDVLRGVSAKVDRIDHDIRKIGGQTQSAEEGNILEWLSSKDIKFSSLQNTSQQTHTAGTGQWLLDGEQFQNWRDRSPGLLWLHGAAGCGKTVLCSTAIRDLEARIPYLAYWYFRFDDITSQDVSKMLRSIIRQLSCFHLPVAVRALHDRHSQRGSEPSLEELATVLDNTITTLKKDVHIVFDALDECPHKDKKGRRDQLLRYIENLMKTNPNLHLLVTSRPEPDIRKELSRLANYSLDVEKLIKGDVERYVKHALEEPRLADWAEDIKDEIRDKLLEYEERRFRWADLQIQRFAQCATTEKLREAMASIPKDLEASYHQAFEAIDNEDRSDVATIMKWLTVSFKPLSASQIAAVVGFRSPDYVLAICSTLLVTIIDEDTTQIIKLAHFSVKEFLIVKPFESSTYWFQFSSELANNTVAIAALQALLEPGDQYGPIIHYAGRNWPQHATEGLKRSERFELEKQIGLLFNSTERFLIWLEIYDPDNKHGYQRHERAGALYYASLLGFEAAVHNLWVDDSQLLNDQGRYGNALNAAAIVGNVAIVGWLMQKCQCATRFLDLVKVAGDIQANARQCIIKIWDSSRDLKITEKVVEAAAGNWNSGYEVMKLLLEKKGDEMQITEEVVEVAAGNEYNGREVMKLLLEKKGDEMQITEEVVKAAAGNGLSGHEVMKLLLEKKGEEMQITEGIIKAAAGNGHTGYEVIELLLEERGDEIQITEEVVKTAAENEDSGYEMIQLLLEERGDKIQITEEVVKAAAENGRNGHEVMKLLLEERGDEIQITEEVVKAAARNWNSGQVMKLLLERKGDEIQITEDVVKAAAGNENSGREVIELLLGRKGDEIKITQDVVVTAAGNRKSGRQMMGLLLKKGANLTAANEDKETPLNAAASNGQTKTVKLLLAIGANPNIADNRGFTPLNSASRSGYVEVVRLLLEGGGDLSIPDNDGFTPLNNASYNGHVEVINVLVESGADLTISENNGWTPLSIASSKGYVATVRTLVSAETNDINTFDENGLTAIAWATKRGHVEVVDLLLKRGANTSISDLHGATCINLAAKEGHLGVVKSLLDHGCQWDVPDSSGSDALQFAILGGHSHIETYLLTIGGEIIDDVYGFTTLFEE